MAVRKHAQAGGLSGKPDRQTGKQQPQTDKNNRIRGCENGGTGKEPVPLSLCRMGDAARHGETRADIY